jgi:uncharacterized SAM-binding protein YcdF (DUF218 family)
VRDPYLHGAHRGFGAKAGRLFVLVLAIVGSITLIVLATPVVPIWAHLYSGPLEQPKGDVLILLSAAVDDDGTISYSSYWRARYALLGWRSGSFKNIVISGNGCYGVEDFLVAEGISPESILIDPQSSSTRSNGLDTAKLIQRLPGKRVLLTSDYHMFRAQRVFRRLGVDVVPMPVPDVTKSGQRWTGRFSGFQTLILESAKIAYYKAHGWI